MRFNYFVSAIAITGAIAQTTDTTNAATSTDRPPTVVGTQMSAVMEIVPEHLMAWIAQVPEQIMANKIEKKEIFGLEEMAGGAALMHRGHRLFMRAVHEMHLNATTTYPATPTGTGPALPGATPEAVMPTIAPGRARR